MATRTTTDLKGTGELSTGHAESLMGDKKSKELISGIYEALKELKELKKRSNSRRTRRKKKKSKRKKKKIKGKKKKSKRKKSKSQRRRRSKGSKRVSKSRKQSKSLLRKKRNRKKVFFEDEMQTSCMRKAVEDFDEKWRNNARDDILLEQWLMIHFCFKRRSERALQGDNSLEESRVERMRKKRRKRRGKDDQKVLVTIRLRSKCAEEALEENYGDVMDILAWTYLFNCLRD